MQWGDPPRSERGEDHMRSHSSGLLRPALALVALLVAACSGGGGASPSPSATATPTAPPSASASAASSATPGSDEASLDAPDEVEAGAEFEVAWTGPNADGDYVTILIAGTDTWTNEDYFYTAHGNPGRLTAPTTADDYELVYFNGADDTAAVRRPITVIPFEGALLGPEEVQAGSTFEVTWNGPDGPGDYVTIVAEGATRWTNESYFYTAHGNPGKLTAPITAGDYTLWYVTGADEKTMATRPITVTPVEVTLDAPAEVDAGSTFEVTWTGPDGPSDYITIVPAGSPDGTYLSYAYTASGNPARITAPTEPGAYEIWYASDRVDGTFGRRPIIVK
jgi:Ca-activated chloride channel family protein